MVLGVGLNPYGSLLTWDTLTLGQRSIKRLQTQCTGCGSGSFPLGTGCLWVRVVRVYCHRMRSEGDFCVQCRAGYWNRDPLFSVCCSFSNTTVNHCSITGRAVVGICCPSGSVPRPFLLPKYYILLILGPPTQRIARQLPYWRCPEKTAQLWGIANLFHCFLFVLLTLCKITYTI